MKYFGTDGVRGKLFEDFDLQFIFKLGQVLGKNKKKILIASDTRYSKDLIKSTMIQALLLSGADVFDIGIISTPAVSYLTAFFHFDYGIMITASHNHYQDNGIKIFDKKGRKISLSLQKKIEKELDLNEEEIKSKRIGQVYNAFYLVEAYLNYLLDDIVLDASEKIVIDTANGANYHLANLVVQRLNLDAKIIEKDPNGYNINLSCGALYPQRVIKEIDENAIGFSFDGDGDRLIVVYKNKILDGDQLLYLFAKAFKDKGVLNKNTITITTASNQGLIESLKKNGINVSIVDVGDQNVFCDLKKNEYSLGGEKSGHILFNNSIATSDSLMTMIMFLLLQKNYSIEELLSDLNLYECLVESLPTKNKSIYTTKKCDEVISKIKNKFNFEGIIKIRPSGTEDLIRIQIESKNKKRINHILKEIKTELESISSI